MKGLRNKSALKQGEKTDAAFPQVTFSRACNNLCSVLERFTLHQWWSQDFNSNEAWFYTHNKHCCFLDPHPSTLSCKTKFTYYWKFVTRKSRDAEGQQTAAFQTTQLQNQHCHRRETALSRSYTDILSTFCMVRALYTTQTTVHSCKSKQFAWGHPKSSPPEPENTPHAGSPPKRTNISSAPTQTYYQYGLFCPPRAHLQSEKPVHQSCCFQRDRYKIQFGSIHRVDRAGAGRNFHQELWGIHRKRATLHIMGLQRFNCF